MANEKDVRELLSLQTEIDDVTSVMSGLMTNDTSLTVIKKSPVFFVSEDSHNTEIEKYVQSLKQELLAGSNASDKSLLYLQNVSSTTIGAVYRGHLGRKLFVTRHAFWLQERRLAATLKIQRWLFMVSGMRQARIRRREIEMEWKSAAATQIQRIYKGRYQTNAVRSVQSRVRRDDFQFHATRGGAFEALCKSPAKINNRPSSHRTSDSDGSTDSSDNDDDENDVPVGSSGWLPRGVRHNVHDESFRKS
jgi:hypothetical protein